MGARVCVGAALVGLALAVVAAIVMPRSPGPLRGEEAAAAFLDAWERQLQGTYVVESDFTRTLVDGRVIDGTTVLAQRPPDRLEVGLGSVEGRLDGRRVDCTTQPGTGLRCFAGDEVDDYDDEVAAELDRLQPYVLGPRPLYRVDGDRHGCFTLTLALGHPSPPYGWVARFCFDPGTGAPTLTETRRPEAVDRTQATSIRSTVTGADLAVPEDAGELPGE